MKTSLLRPACHDKVRFNRYEMRRMPCTSGCYALANHEGEILYVGQGSLRDRMDAHLDNSEKTAATPIGKVFWFYYIVADKSRLNRIEGGWMRQHEDIEGGRPILNKIDAPSF